VSAASPVETFKRVLGATTKALAGEPDLDVQFGGEVAGLVKSGGVDHLVLPTPPVKQTEATIAKSRGEADALALKLALHDPEVFAKDLPRPGPARAICEALEQARVESLGAKVMDGVSDNLHAALDARCTRRGFHQDGLSQDDVPMAEAMGLIAREVFSGRGLPDGANGIMKAWRTHIESIGSEALAKLSENMEDQAEFAKYTQELLKTFDLGDELADPEQGVKTKTTIHRTHRKNKKNKILVPRKSPKPMRSTRKTPMHPIPLMRMNLMGTRATATIPLNKRADALK